MSCMLVNELPIALPEGRWELKSSSFADIGRFPGVPRATLDVLDGRISVFSGCNTGSGAVTAIDGRMVVSALTKTRRACPEPLGGFEAQLFKMLHAQPYFRIEAAELTLAAGNRSARFRRTPLRESAGQRSSP